MDNTKRYSTGSENRGTLSSSDWVNAAIDVLVVGGVTDVKIERLATSLGVSKGSFYWHFKNRDELLQEVLQEWSRVATYDVEKRLGRKEPDPARRLLHFMELPLHSRRAIRMANLELAIMGWARLDHRARAAFEAANRARTNTAYTLLRAIGISESAASDRAHEVYALIRYLALRRDLSVDERLEFARRVHGHLIRPD